VLLQDPGSGLWGYSICIAKDGGFKRVATAANIPKAELAQRDLVARLHELA
jgi:hypothetical protein